MLYENEIKSHQSKVKQLEDKVIQLKNNFTSNKNQLLSENINNKILNLEISQMENEIQLHYFCIDSILNNKHLDLVIDHKFNNARKKKLNKLLKKTISV